MRVLPRAVEHAPEHIARGVAHCFAPAPLQAVEQFPANIVRGDARCSAPAILELVEDVLQHSARDEESSLFRALQRPSHFATRDATRFTLLSLLWSLQHDRT